MSRIGSRKILGFILYILLATVPAFSGFSDVLSFAVRPNSYFAAFREYLWVFLRVRLTTDTAKLVGSRLVFGGFILVVRPSLLGSCV